MDLKARHQNIMQTLLFAKGQLSHLEEQISSKKQEISRLEGAIMNLEEMLREQPEELTEGTKLHPEDVPKPNGKKVSEKV